MVQIPILKETLMVSNQSQSQSFRPSPVTRLALADVNGFVPPRHSPRQNHLLSALPLEDYERLLQFLVPVTLPAGCTIYGPGEPEDFLFFITEGIVCRFYMLQNAESAEFAVCGHEGVVGIAAFLGGESVRTQMRVVSAGCAYRLRVDRLNEEIANDGPLLRLLLRYTHVLIMQASQIAA